jgi:hypothetical protein
MATDIKCPHCGHKFPMEEAVSEEYKKELREQMLSYKKQKDEEMNKREVQLNESIRKSVSADFENRLKLLQQAQADNEEKLKTARTREMEFLRKEQELQTKEQELELTVQRQLLKERGQLSEKIRLEEAEKIAMRETEHQLRVRELEKQLDDQKKLAEEMRRKAEQGSMQLQGEAQELALEELLAATFPFDLIEEVGKGIRGADCIQVVRNKFGNDCGKIIYESKRTKDFAKDWVEKLKADMRKLGADVAILVTQAMPKDMERFGEREGIWICTFSEVTALAYVLRDGILRVHSAGRSQENRGEKMHMLYDYLTSNEFAEQWKAIREGFMSMKLSIQRERDTMEKLWKMREKQLEKVLLNATHIKGSVEGIAGSDSVDLRITDDDALLLD